MRVPVIRELPKAPAFTLPDSVSPSMVALASSFIANGEVISMRHVILLPATLPSSSSMVPLAPAFFPVKELTLHRMVRTVF